MSDKWYISGPLGIGTAPDYPLHLKTEWGFLALDSNAAGQDAGLRLMEGGAVKWHVWNHAGNESRFLIRNKDFRSSLCIDQAGYVGVGTEKPEHPLHLKTDWSLLALDTNAAGQDSGIRLMEAGTLKWHIYNAAQVKKLHIAREGLGASLTIDERGNVGIGTTTPLAPLQIGAGTDSPVRPAGLYIANPTGSSQLDMKDCKAKIEFQIFTHEPEYQGFKGHTFLGTYSNHRLVLRTADMDRVMITETGNVGIGTTIPSAGLEINKGATNDLALRLNSSGAGWGSGVQFRNTAQGGKTYGIYSGWGSLHFADVDNGVDRLVIDSSGNVNMFSSGFSTLTVGAGKNGAIKVRHINGKSHQNDNNDGLYLNWDTGQPVCIGGGAPSMLQVNGTFAIIGPTDDGNARQILDSLPPYSVIVAVEELQQGTALVFYWKDGSGQKRKAWDQGQRI